MPEVNMISARIADLREKSRSGYYKQYRKYKPDFRHLEDELCKFDVYRAGAEAFRRMLGFETPVIISGERLQYTRTIDAQIPAIAAGVMRRQNPGKNALIVENMAPDYAVLLDDGLEKRIEKAWTELQKCTPESEEYLFLESVIEMAEDIIKFSIRYADAAEAAGENELAALMIKVPRFPAETLQEALQAVYFYNAMLRLSAHIHIGFGRFDQYILKFYRQDIESGRESKESARELLAEFFLALCRDYDLYHGVQLGDNGQSLMLGGCLRDGSSAENELTILVMEISAELKMIDPKINLRIDRNTSQRCLEAAAELSGCGLGFPQYNNDETVIPGLVKFGYPIEDARDYYVAACWEFVVKKGRDVPNIAALNMAYAADRAIRNVLKNNMKYEDIFPQMKKIIREIVDSLKAERVEPLIHVPGPLFSVLEDNCIARHADINSGGGDHYHYGMHGSGSSTAADSIAAVKHFVFDTGKVTASELLAALENNFSGFEELQQELKNASCKVGCSDTDADEILKKIFDIFADVLAETEDNGRGGKIRPGTGSAMYYVWFTRDEKQKQYLKATADGRGEKEYISASLAPAPGVKASGMLSVLKSYSKIDYSRVCNGGPITMEFDPVCFSSSGARQKMTSLIKAFINSKCQQLQWNVLDADVLRHAQKYPEQHRDLVVRVWGWSGFFVELDKVYQDQIIGRTSYKG